MLSELTAKSEGLLERVNVAVELQQKANRVLVHILGAQYTLGSIFSPCFQPKFLGFKF